MTNNSLSVDQIVDGFIAYLTNNNLLDLGSKIAQKLSHRFTLGSEVRVITPTALNENQKKSAISLINGFLGSEDAVFSFEEDPGVIDGMKIVAGDKLYDLTLLGKVKSISEGL